MLSERTFGDLCNGRLVHLSTETGQIPDAVRRLDELTDRLMVDPDDEQDVAEARHLVGLLQTALPEYTHEEIRWQIMHRYNSRQET